MLTLESTESHAEMTGEQRPKGEEGGSHMDPGKKNIHGREEHAKAPR